MKRRASFAFVLLVAVAAADARADAGDAWSYAKGVLPADTVYVVGADLDAIRKTGAFGEIYPLISDRTGIRTFGDQIMTACQIDIKEAIQGAVIAWTEKRDSGAIYVAGPRFEAKSVIDCMQKYLAAQGGTKKPKITAGAPGAQGVVEISAEGEKDKVYLAFPKKGVMVMAFDPTQKQALVRWVSGKGVGAGTDLARSLGKISTAAPAWGAVGGVKEPLGDPDARIKSAAAQATTSAGKIQLDFKLSMASPKDAQTAQTKAQRELADAKKQSGTPPEIVKAMDSLKLTVRGDELAGALSIAEGDLISLVKQMK